MSLKRFRVALAGVAAVAAVLAGPVSGSSASTGSSHYSINCAVSPLCLEVNSPSEIFKSTKYVGHDEPSALFYSDRAGSGNSSLYQLSLPTDPSPKTGGSFNFQLHVAFWFGMALCNVQSYPEQIST